MNQTLDTWARKLYQKIPMTVMASVVAWGYDCNGDKSPVESPAERVLYQDQQGTLIERRKPDDLIEQVWACRPNAEKSIPDAGLYLSE